MTELDQALEALRQDMNDPKSQSKFYDLFLNSTYFVPNMDERDATEAGEGAATGHVLPLVIESEGNDYLMLFDSKERMNAWAQAEVGYVEVPGFVLAATTQPPLHWALNVGTPYSKQFLPDEIAWLREVVERCNAEADKGMEEKSEE
ncbi:MAG TPA: SseB family protein [Geobacteraceae bacterium]|nr:SseB family protein [Geobacteraceae bacterium]